MSTRALLAALLLAGCGAATPRDVTSAGGPAGASTAPGPRSAAGASPAPPAPGARLPDDVRPRGYTLELDLRPARERYTGRVAIDVELSRATNAIWLTGVGLHVSSARVAPAGGAEIAARWEPRDDGLAALRLPRAVGPGRATLTIAFDAAFAARPGGLFRRRVGAGWAAFSRFEATWARHAFPCFDEPGLAAPFDLTLIVARHDTAFANGRAVAEEPAAGGARRVRFATTPPLAPHRLTWAVGPLDVVEVAAAAGPFPRAPIALRGVTARGGEAELRAALDRAASGVEALERVLGGAAPIDALDVVAVPGIDDVLLDAGPEGEQAVLHVVAATWARRLAAPRWWSELWLREGLTLWMAHRMLEALHPESGESLEQVRRLAWVMGEDALPGARRVRAPVDGPADIVEAFDPGAWHKAAALLGMIEAWLGPETFRRVLRERGAEAEPPPTDVFAALSSASGQDVVGVVASFVDQAGVPVVAVSRQCAEGRLSLALRQSRWLPVGSTLRADRTYRIPFCVLVGGAASPRRACTLLEGAAGSMPLEGAPCGAWVMPNAGAAGTYRWAQSAADERLLATAAWPSLSPRERVAVATNLAAELHAGSLPAADVLSLLPALARAEERAVVEMPMAILASLADGVADARTMPRVHALGRRLYAPAWARLGWQPARAARPDPDASILRGEVARYLALVTQDPTLRTEAAFRGRAAVAGGALHPEAVLPELRDVALAVAAEVGDRAFFESLLSIHSTTQDPVSRRALLAALGRARDPALARRALELALDEALPVTEAPVTFAAQMQRPESRDAAWAWLRDRWDALRARVGPAWMVAWTRELGAFCDEAHAAEVEAFVGPRLAGDSGGAAGTAAPVQAIRRCAALAEAQRSSTAAFFRGN